MARPSRNDIALAVLSLKAKSSQKRVAHALAAYLSLSGRTDELSAVMREVGKLQAQNNGVTETTVTTAHPASVQVKKQISDLLGGKKVIMNEVVDPSVIGGVRVESSDFYLDLTVRGRLDRFKTMKTGVK